METKYLIIGNSAGGIGAAEAIRQVGDTGPITIVSDEPYPAYSRPLISKYLSGEYTLDMMLLRPADFYNRQNITTLLGTGVKSLDVEQRRVTLDNGEQITWEKLLLAPGGRPIVPGIKGVENGGVFTFTTLDDAKAIDSFLENAGSAVVIGGGFIGFSVTEALLKRGVAVTVVEMEDRTLKAILDEQASHIAEEALEKAGVTIVTGHMAVEIGGEGTVRDVALDDGTRVPCDLVVLAIGVSPRTELARDAGIKIGRGIIVDRQMATSSPDVYACGDAAESYDFVSGTDRLLPIWPTASLGGRVAGLNMAGQRTEYPGWTSMNAINYFGLDIVAAGIVDPPEGGDFEVISREKGNLYQKVVLKDDLLVGLVFASDIEKSGILFGLMRDRVNVANFKEALLTDSFGLAYLPKELWQQKLAPQ
ncbi:MAG: FAD-dependent oxidoreductase [Dehalococcoidia bacterium]